MFGLQLPFIKVPPSTRIAFQAGRQYCTFVLYNGNFISISSYYSYSGERIITTTSATRAVFTARAVPLISAQMHNMTLKNFGMVFDHLLRMIDHQPKRLIGFLG